MKATRLLNVPLLSASVFLGFALSAASAHDREEHHYYDHVRAHELNHHADRDRHHAAHAMDRAYATGDPRDFVHVLRDRAHAKRASHAARHADEHARSHGYYYDY